MLIIIMLGGAQFSLTLNGGKYKGNDDEKETAQSAQLTLECDTSQSRNVSIG